MWPIRPPPQPDELLSSWIVRLAAANGIKVSTFLHVIADRERAFSQDVDRFVPPDLAGALSDGTGLTAERVGRMGLSAFEGIVFPRFTRRGCTAWLLPIGVYHATRLRYGMQFCPECLATDMVPYYRRRWRLGCVSACLRHRRMLCDRCPHCEAPLAVHRGTLGTRREFVGDALTRCMHCHGSLAEAPAIVIPRRLRRFQGLLESALDDDHHDIPGPEGPLHLTDFLAVLRQFARLLAHGQWGAPLRRVARELGAHLPTPSVTVDRFVFEESSLDDRSHLLDGALLLWGRWPSSFARLCKKHGAWRSNLLSDFANPPGWYVGAVERDLYLPGFYPNGPLHHVTARRR